MPIALGFDAAAMDAVSASSTATAGGSAAGRAATAATNESPKSSCHDDSTSSLVGK